MSLVRFRPEAPKPSEIHIVSQRVPKESARCRCSSSGRAPPCQGGGSEFEPRHLLHVRKYIQKRTVPLFSIWRHSQAVRQSSAKALFPSSILGGASKKRSTCKAGASFFGYLGNLKCSGQVNCPCAKVLPAAKRLYGAKAPPRCAGPRSCPASIVNGQDKETPANRLVFLFVHGNLKMFV